ncbi:hypothetical protein [Nocardioides sp. cx-173]|uniref:hypothetical protein n=1 Tax=Nocardioides sp. cx-173 TaxID=2898796 RepID=UPI001E45E4D4|nr:hypothetical protein [Nocardioides sp. cx-173]MCD4526428.1 hypothetical protein [Nocardioides sp. cx-173]UGB41118.1 hypothetical protein LQ940_17315 [Nocardioides sp. cx-173]
MSRNLGSPGAAPPPPAVRAATPGWRDPRLWIGVAIVAASVVGGARLLAAADDTVSVWGVATDMGAGDLVTEDDLVAHRVRFADDAQLDRYFTSDDALPADLELLRGVGEGELLPRGAVGPAEQTDTLQVPISVSAERVPASVGAGSVVDVFIVARSTDPQAPGPGGPGEPALQAVTVVAAPGLDDTFGASGERQLDLAVPERDAQAFFELLNSFDSPVLTVVRRG